MQKFGIGDILNLKRQPTMKTEEYKEIYLNPYDVKPSETNFYSQEGIEELADSILTVGQQQPTVLGRVNGEFKIVSGHRRNLANILNIERGHEQFKSVRFLYKDMTQAMFELSLLIGNAYCRELTAWEKTEQAARLKAALLRAKKEDGLKIAGKLREAIAELMNESETNIARMESVYNNAAQEIKEELKNGSIGISAAYEAAKLPHEEQRAIAKKAAAGEAVRAKEIALLAQRRKKTAEQQYNDEQAKIDRQTKKRLQEMEDKEKMKTLPSEKNVQKCVVLSKRTFQEIRSKKLPYLLLRNEGYKAGELILLQEYNKGKATGQEMETYVSSMDDENTHTAIADGYCALGICEKEFAIKMGWLSESDTDCKGKENYGKTDNK